MSILFAIGVVGVFLVSVIGIVAYILMAIGLYRLGENQNIPNAWLAWIPIAQLYVIGAILKEVKIGDLTIPRMELVFPLAAIGVSILSGIPALGWLISLCFYAFTLYSLYLLFKLYVPSQAVLYTILGALGLFPIFIFIIRDKDQVATVE